MAGFDLLIDPSKLLRGKRWFALKILVRHYYRGKFNARNDQETEENKVANMSATQPGSMPSSSLRMLSTTSSAQLPRRFVNLRVNPHLS